MNQLVDWKSI